MDFLKFQKSKGESSKGLTSFPSIPENDLESETSPKTSNNIEDSSIDEINKEIKQNELEKKSIDSNIQLKEQISSPKSIDSNIQLKEQISSPKNSYIDSEESKDSFLIELSDIYKTLQESLNHIFEKYNQEINKLYEEEKELFLSIRQNIQFTNDNIEKVESQLSFLTNQVNELQHTLSIYFPSNLKSS